MGTVHSTDSNKGLDLVQSPALLALKEPKQQEFVRILTTPPFPQIREAGIKAGYSEWHGYELHSREDIQAAIREQLLLRRQAHEQFILATIESLYVRGRAGDNKAAELFLEAMGVIGRAAQLTINNNTTTVFALPERLQAHLDKRRQLLRDAGLVSDAPTVARALPAAGNGKGNGHDGGNDSGA